MRSFRNVTPATTILALTIILAACGQVAANPPTSPPQVSAPPSPSEAPSEAPSEEPTIEPTPTQVPSRPPSPTPAPTPRPIEVVVHELPMLGRVTADGVNVRSLPSIDAPLISGERYDLSRVPDIKVNEGDLVFATLGPVVADGHAWYLVGAADAGDVYWQDGWIAGEYLVREGGVPSYNPIVVAVHGQGEGASASADVPMGSPLTVDFAAAPVDGAESCDIDVTVIRTDGLGVNVATETVIASRVERLSAFELPSLFQEEAGTATLQVESDCSFAASITMPQA